MDTAKFPNHLDCEALTGLTADHLPRDGSLGRVRRYTKGADLWQADDPADRVYFLRRGRVEIMTATPHERPVVLRTIEAGQPFGALCVCTSRAGTRDTTAHALVACEATEIKLSAFLDYLRQDRAALEALVCTLCLRLTDTEHRVEVLAHRGAEQRLGRLMIRLGTVGTLGKLGPRGGRGAPRSTVTLSLSHNELAKMAGMTRPHVTVTLGRLRRRGLVHYSREGPLRVDVPGLTAYLGRLTQEAG